MKPLDSISFSSETETEAESVTTTVTTTMDNFSNSNNNNNNKHRRNNNNSNSEEDQQDPRVWRSLNTSFKQVQSVLDRNRVLIKQVNENHQSKIPDNMVKNVALIHEINGNISKVVNLYSDMSTNFSSAFHQRSKDSDGDRDSGDDA
ncbi:hypothetical protein LWI28_017270 [Acer negundo]|uniref:Protein EARLY FLOWERING 4 domain-containing protein n=1 Tax=Acer negundo TaxID=4023 RepID=A0AAD5NGP3_ACENE|nr:hypothetical protein LWI28_017270 [Acer negundo]KAK4836135.1 hypothetical protein QYF36_019013 [Acer negundo]